MGYELKLPNGVGEKMLANAIDKFDVKLKHTDFGPVLTGDIDELKNAEDFIIKALNERLRELE
jgi:hypothetical protein